MSSKNTKEESEAKAGRRKFIRKAAAGAAGLGVLALAIDEFQKLGVKTSPEQLPLTETGTSTKVFANYKTVSYIIFTDHTYYYALNGTTGTIDYGGPNNAGSTSGLDPGAVIQSCITALATQGGVIQLRNGVYSYTSTVPAFPSGLTYPIGIIGEKGAIIQLSSSAPSAFNFNKTADYQTFQNILLEGFWVNANKVATSGHYILGTLDTTGSPMTRINISDIWIRKIRLINGLVDPSMSSDTVCVGFAISWSSGDSNCTFQRIYVEDVRMDGANNGVWVIAEGDTPSGAFMDEIHLHRCRHSCLSAPTASFSASNFIIGNKGYGGFYHIADCYAEYSGDDCFEVDGASNALIENCTARDPWISGYDVTNYTAPLEQGKVAIVNCRTRIISLSTSALGYGVGVFTSDSLGLDVVEITSFRYYNSSPAQGGSQGINVLVSGGMERLLVRDYTQLVTGLSTGGPTWFNLIDVHGSGYPNEVLLKDWKIEASGTGQNNSDDSVKGLVLGATVMRVDGYTLDFNFTNLAPRSSYGINIGHEVTCTVQTGIFRNLLFLEMSNDVTPRVIAIGDNTTMTLNGPLYFEHIDFSALSNNPGTHPDEFHVYGTNSTSNDNKIVLGRGIIWAPGGDFTASTIMGVFDNPFNNQRYEVGPFSNIVANGSASAVPVANQDYLVKNSDLILEVEGGTGVSVTLKDNTGNTIKNYGPTPVIIYSPINSKINFSSAPSQVRAIIAGL